MKISRLRKLLKDKLDIYGDIEVVKQEYEGHFDIEEIIFTTHDETKTEIFPNGCGSDILILT